MNQHLPNLSLQRSSRRIKKLQNDLHLTLFKRKEKGIHIKSFEPSCNESLSSSMAYFPPSLHELLKDLSSITKDHLYEFEMNLPIESEKNLVSQLQDMRELIRTQDERIKGLSEENLKNIQHETLLEYLKKISFKKINQEENFRNYSEDEFFSFRSKESFNLNETNGIKEESIDSSWLCIKEKAEDYNGKRLDTMERTNNATPNTSKRNSPLFSEKKNLLLSSKIEDIINEGDETLCRRFEEEDLSIESCIGEKHFDFENFLKNQEQDNEEIEDDYVSLRKINESLLMIENDNVNFF